MPEEPVKAAVSYEVPDLVTVELQKISAIDYKNGTLQLEVRCPPGGNTNDFLSMVMYWGTEITISARRK